MFLQELQEELSSCRSNFAVAVWEQDVPQELSRLMTQGPKLLDSVPDNASGR